MGIGDFFKNLSEKEEIDEFTGLPKHLVEKQEKGFIENKKQLEKESLEKNLKISIEGVIGQQLVFLEASVPNKFIEKFAEIFIEKLIERQIAVRNVNSQKK